MQLRIILPLAGVAATLVLAGCGSSTPVVVPVMTSSAIGATAVSSSPTPAPTTTSTTAPVDALVAEAQSAAAGDIPDNQAFITFTNAGAGYTIKYPEGWAQKGSGSDVTIRDRSTVLHVVVSTGAPPSATSVAAELAVLATTSPTLKVTGPPTLVAVGNQSAVKATYETMSEPSPVTGKRVTLVVDRYVLTHGGRVMVVDLGTQRGVDNVDAFRLMIESVRWTS